MPSIKILIVEDEELIADDMANQLIKLGYEITDCVDNCDSALQSVKNNLPDLIFLDIMIAGKKNGIETAIMLKAIDDFPIIFLTNLSDSKTLQKALATNPAAYLIKPFSANQLHVSIHTAINNSAEKRKISIDDIEPEHPNAVVRKGKLFLKDSNDTYKKYDIADILFIEADRAYCHIYLTNKTKLTQSISMGALNIKINHDSLIRAHRSHVVNINNVDAVKGNVLVLGDYEIAVGDTFKEDVFKHLPLI